MKANVLRSCGLLGLFIVTLLFSTSAFAQKDNCKLQTKFDEFTSTKITTGSETVIGGKSYLGNLDSWDLSIYFFSENNLYFMAITYSSQGITSTIPQFSIKLDDGTFMKKDKAVHTSRFKQGLGYNATKNIFSLTQAEIETLSTVSIVKIKSLLDSFSGKPEHENDVKSKNAEKVKESALCILKQTTTPTAKL